MLWVIVGFLIIVGIIMIFGFVKFQFAIKQVSPEYVVEFFKENKSGDNIALSIQHNDEMWINMNQCTPLQLASTVQIIIAIEFAQQAADKRIDPQQDIPLTRLDTFNIPETDGGAYKNWLNSLSLDHTMDSVPLIEVVKGMIEYNSNANVDFLVECLGLENINKVPGKLGISDHEPFYPIVSSMFIPVELAKNKKLTQQQLLFAMRDLSIEEYRQMAIDIHKQLMSQPPTASEKRRAVKTLNASVQRAWAERLPQATTEGYVSIMKMLNSKTYFSKDVHKYLDPILEHVMNNPKSKGLSYAGQKAGSTATSVAMVMYATDKEHNQTELALLASNLNAIEQVKLSRSLNDFQRKFLTDETFRAYVKDKLADPPNLMN